MKIWQRITETYIEVDDKYVFGALNRSLPPVLASNPLHSVFLTLLRGSVVLDLHQKADYLRRLPLIDDAAVIRSIATLQHEVDHLNAMDHGEQYLLPLEERAIEDWKLIAGK